MVPLLPQVNPVFKLLLSASSEAWGEALQPDVLYRDKISCVEITQMYMHGPALRSKTGVMCSQREILRPQAEQHLQHRLNRK